MLRRKGALWTMLVLDINVTSVPGRAVVVVGLVSRCSASPGEWSSPCMEVMLTKIGSLSVSQVFLQLYALSLEDLGRQM